MKKLGIFILLFSIKQANSQIITTIAGNGTCCNPVNGGQATASSIYYPNGVAIDASGNIFISESNQIRKVNTSGVISIIAGSTGGYSGDGGPAINAKLKSIAVVVDNSGNIYSADWFNSVIRKINTAGIISTVAGNGTDGFSGDGGPATTAQLNGPYGIAVDDMGNLYIADSDNNRIRKVNPSGIITTFAGNGIGSFSGDGGLSTSASLYNPMGLCFDSGGNLYISDWNNYRIRKVNTSGIITTVAGNGVAAFSGDSGLATVASLNKPSGVACDLLGNVYIADAGANNRIRKVDTSGIINTFAGNGTWGYNGDGIQATAASLANPWGIAIDILGNLYIADQDNYRIRKVNQPVNINHVINNYVHLTIYPNPCSSGTILQSNNFLRNATLTVDNISGQTVAQIKNINGQTVTFNRDNLASGLYFVRLTQDNQVIAIKKLIITD